MDAVAAAQNEGLITEGAKENIANWLTQARYQEYLPELLSHIEQKAWKKYENIKVKSVIFCLILLLKLF